MNPNIVFMGTPEFSVPALEALHSQFGICVVVTAPDKPKGRGLAMQASPVKKKALELGLPVLQPEKLKDTQFAEQLSVFEPDIICVIAFRILPQQIYLMPKIASFNIHSSILPKFRGAAPINWTIIKGETETGLTSFVLQEKVDTGDILIQKRIPLKQDMTAGELHDLLMPSAASMAVDTVRLLISGNYKPKPQPKYDTTPAPKIFKNDCRIDWNKPAKEVKFLIHGLSPYPGAWTTHNNKLFKILRCRDCADYTMNLDSISPAAGYFVINDNGIFVRCNDVWLEIIEIQQESKKAMKSLVFVKGWRGSKVNQFD